MTENDSDQSRSDTATLDELQDELAEKERELEELRDELHEAEEELETAEEEAAEYKDDLQRLQAEFQNYKKRVEKEKEEYKKFARKELMEGLVGVLDDFERALDELRDAEDVNVEGMEMIFDNLHEQLRDEGITPIEAEGKQFDPDYHDCIRQVKSEEENGTVIAEYQKGYLFHDKILRPAKVIVSGDTNE